MSLVSVVTKKIKVDGRGLLTVMLAEINGKRGMTIANLAELLGVTRQATLDMVRRHNLGTFETDKQDLSLLRDQGVIPLRGTIPRLLTEESVQEIVKLVNTEEARAIYAQLWEQAKNPGVDPALLAQIEELKVQVQGLVGCLELNQAHAAAFALEHTVASRQCQLLYPTLWAAAMQFRTQRLRNNPKKYSAFNKAGFFTLYLQSRYSLSTRLAEWVDTNEGKKGANRWDKAVLDWAEDKQVTFNNRNAHPVPKKLTP